VKRASAELAAGLVVELQPSGVLVEASSFPRQRAVGGRGRADEGGQQVHGTAKGVEDGPGQLPRQQGEYVLRVERELRGSRARIEQREEREEEEEKQQKWRTRSH